MEIIFQPKRKNDEENANPRADHILTGFQEPITIDDDDDQTVQVDPSSLGLPGSFESKNPPEERLPKDPNRPFSISKGNRNFKCIVSMWQSRRTDTHKKPAKFSTTILNASDRNRKYRTTVKFDSLDNYDKSYVHNFRWAAENFAARELLDYIISKGLMWEKEEESYYEFRDSYNILEEAEQRESAHTAKHKEERSDQERPKRARGSRGSRGARAAEKPPQQKHGWAQDGGWKKDSGSSGLTTPSTYQAKHGSNSGNGLHSQPGLVTGVTYGGGRSYVPPIPVQPPMRSGWTPSGGGYSGASSGGYSGAPSGGYGGASSSYNSNNAGYQWAGAPGATSWQSQSKPLLYPPPNWAKVEVTKMILPMKIEMSALFDQPWFLEMTGDSQRSAWYAKRAEMEMKYASELQSAKQEEERRMLKESQSLIETIKKAKESTGYSDTVKARIKNFNWKDLSCYTEEELSCKNEDVEEEIEKNKEQFASWQTQCRQWETHMRGKSFVSQMQIQKIEDTKSEWKAMEGKFKQVETKMRGQVNVLSTEIEFRNAPKPPSFFETDIFQRPVSPTPEPKRYEPDPSPPPVLSFSTGDDLEIVDDLPSLPVRYERKREFDYRPSSPDLSRGREPPLKRRDDWDPPDHNQSYSPPRQDYDPVPERFSERRLSYEENRYGFTQPPHVYDYNQRSSPPPDRWGLSPQRNDHPTHGEGWRSPDPYDPPQVSSLMPQRRR